MRAPREEAEVRLAARQHVRTRFALPLALTVMAMWGAAVSPTGVSAQPKLLLMHPGGFAGGDPSMESAAASYARSVGFSTESLDYPLCDIRGALSFTAQVASSVDGPVYAYGDSAGGTLAARLTERNLVRAGAGYSPVANVRRFVNDRRASCIGNTDRLTGWAASPDAHRSPRHFLELIADGEYPAVYRQAEVDWANADPIVIGRDVSGFHIGSTSRPTYLQHMHEAIDWLAQRAGLVPPTPTSAFA